MIINIPGITANSVVPVDVPTTNAGTEFQTLIKVASNDASKSGGELITSTLPIKITGTSEQTAKGVRRVLVKVELPYTSLRESNCESGCIVVDSSKSGDPISLHMVLTIPKQAGLDLACADDIAIGVKSKVAILQSLLESILRTGNYPVSGEMNLVDATQQYSMCSKANVINVTVPSDATLYDIDTPFMRGMSLLKPFTNRVYGYQPE